MPSWEVRLWEEIERAVRKVEFAARTNLVVYLTTTRKVVVLGCFRFGGLTESGG